MFQFLYLCLSSGTDWGNMVVSVLMELEDKFISSYEIAWPLSNTPYFHARHWLSLKGSSNVRNPMHVLTPLFQSILAQLFGIGLVRTFYSRHSREERRPHQLYIVLFTIETVPQPDAPG